MDNGGATRCGLPDRVEYRYILNSPDGPLKAPRSGTLAATFQRAHRMLTGQSGWPRALYQAARRHLWPFKAQYSTRIGDKSSEMPGGSA